MNQDLFEQLHLIELIMSHGDLKKAQAMLEDITSNHPDDYHVSSMLGECYLMMGKPQKAIKPLRWASKKSLQLKQSKKKKRTLKKILSKNQNDEKKTVSSLKKKLNKNEIDNRWVDHYLLGCAYGRCMKFRTAIKHLNIADQMYPDNTEIIRNLGWIRCMQQKKRSGRTLLERAINLDPNNALAYNDLGASYMFDENFDEAQKWIGKAMEMDPDDPFIHDTADKLENLMAYKVILGRVPKE